LNFELVSLLEKVLGKSRQKKVDEYSFKCPFCTHHKKRFRINFTLKKFHCFACHAGGHRIGILLRKINAPREITKDVLKILDEYISYSKDKEENKKYDIALPKEYKPLYVKSELPVYKHAIHYLTKRGIRISDILRYSIGYCDSGLYSNRIIVPSYDADGKLNYFIARSIFGDGFKYKNPPMSKDTVCFELLINWNEPIVLCEGMFDAIAIRRNAIPLLGKFPSKTLIKKIIEKNVKKVYVALDNDAVLDAVKLSKFLMDYGINTYLLEMKDKDPSELGFNNFWKLTDDTKESKFSDLIKKRLNV
tara:strand:- start:361 stop:1275 length:915 start_codon:yes stop_codon:yes gene_type:complete